MAGRETAEKWLLQLTRLPTASGLEHEVVDWVRSWVNRRSDLRLELDSGGNVLITQKGRVQREPVLAVAHMDHPAFVITGTDGAFEFRGGVDAAYFIDAPIHVVSRESGPRGRVIAYDPKASVGTAQFGDEVARGDIAMWRFRSQRPKKGRFQAPACDDLAGVAAALAALDKARQRRELRHFGLLLTRAEEVGLIGAIHAAKKATIPRDSRLISIETSRELPHARMGDGPIIRTGDRSTVFDRELTNRITNGARAAGLKHQRKLMDGGGCEATAFGLYGYQSTGLCLALGNWHNRGNLAEVEAGDESAAVAMLEEISLNDFHGLVDLLLVAAHSIDDAAPAVAGLDRLYESNAHYLQ